MLPKWKSIITNWINCYFNESDNAEQCVTLESLLSIISHLRENLNLDESKSSILEAHTVQEFVREKYPEFTFESGSVEATSDEELYVVASLLLFFVCVNSKDLDIKHAMCSKLCLEDQEVILKFSKSLMECSPITYKDVQTAISEACQQCSAVLESASSHCTVSETPPALRSLHGEVRRLQAALEAERFDRNYLQEELARTNLRVEKLSTDKEQYKLEIVNLKAKISMCCGQESDSRAGDAAAEGTAKLMRQLQETEERLIDTQGQLEDAQYERDVYKAKVDELKKERDKWLTLSQQETALNSQLSEELETERRHVQSLKELVVELRQHHQLNRCDSSQLECDDLDSSIHSLQHNSSVCSEACANVVEVQLGEERAKLMLLNQQNQTLQEQLHDLANRNETEKQNLEMIISERDNDIFSLKHRINEEIEEKNNLAIQYSDEISKLNNELNELEQKLKDNNNQSRLVIESKMHDIQTLQEEKLSLLQSLNDETSKLENIIKNLKSELETERSSRAKMKEDYENHIIKLNEKVLNRNNELVELQNNVFDKSDKIESLQMELRQQKEAKDVLITKFHEEFEQNNEMRIEVENKLKQKCEEVETLSDRLNCSECHVHDLRQEINYLKISIADLSESCRILEETKVTLLNDIRTRDNVIDETKAQMMDQIRIREDQFSELQKQMENMKNSFCEEKNTLVRDYNDKINSLSKTISETRHEISRNKESYTAVIQSKERDIQTLQQENQSLNNELNDVKLQLDLKVHSLKEKLTDNENLTEKLKQTYECQIDNLNVMVTKLSNYLKDKTFELDCSRKEKDRLQQIVSKDNEVIKSLEEEVKVHKQNQEKLVSEFDSERQVLKNMVTVTESVMEDQKIALNNVISDHTKEKEVLMEEIKTLKSIVDTERKDAEVKNRDKNTLIENYNKELYQVRKDREKVAMDYENEKQSLVGQINDLKEGLSLKISQILALQIHNKELTETLQKCKDEISSIEESNNELKITKDSQEAEFTNKFDKISEELKEQVVLNTQLKNLIEDKNKMSVELEEKVKSLNNELKMLMQDQNIMQHKKSELDTEIEEFKTKMYLEITEANEEISRLNQDKLKLSSEFTNKIDKISEELKEQLVLNKQLKNVIEDKDKMSVELEQKVKTLNNQIQMLMHDQTIMQQKKSELDTEVEEFKTKIYLEITEANEEISRLKEEKLTLSSEFTNKVEKISEELKEQLVLNKQLKNVIEDKDNMSVVLEEKVKSLNNQLEMSIQDKNIVQQKKTELDKEIEEFKTKIYFEITEANEEISRLKEDNLKLTNKVNEYKLVIKSLEGETKSQKQNQEKLIHEFELERQILKKTVAVAKSVLEDQKVSLNKVITEHLKANQRLKEENESLKQKIITEKNTKEKKMRLKQSALDNVNKELVELRNEKEILQKELDIEKQGLICDMELLKKDINSKCSLIETLEVANKELADELQKCKTDILLLEVNNNETKANKEALQTELMNKLAIVSKDLDDQLEINKKITTNLEETNTLYKKIEELSKSQQKEIEVLSKREEELTNNINSISKQLDDQQNMNKVLMTELETKTELVKNTEESVKSINKEIENLTIANKKLEDYKNEYKMKLEEIIVNLDKNSVELNKEIENLKEDNLKLTSIIKENKQVIQSLQDTLTSQKHNLVKQITDLKSEKDVLINKVATAESALEEQKSEYLKEKQSLTEQIKKLKEESKITKDQTNEEKKYASNKIKEKETMLETIVRELSEVRREKEDLKKDLESEKITLIQENDTLKKEINRKLSQIEALESQNKELTIVLQKCQDDIGVLQENNEELKIQKDSRESELSNEIKKISNEFTEQVNINKKIETSLERKEKIIEDIEEKVKALNNQVEVLTKAYNRLEQEKNEYKIKVEELKSEKGADTLKLNEQVEKLKEDNMKFTNSVEEKKLVILNLEQAIEQEKERNNELQTRNNSEKLNLNNKCSILQEYQTKAEKQLEEREKDLVTLQEELKTLKSVVNICENDLKEKNGLLEEKNAVISTINKELIEEKAAKEKIQIELEAKAAVYDLRQKLESATAEEALKALRNEEWVRAVVQRETITVAGSERTGSHHKNSGPFEKDYRDQHQVDNTTSDLTHSSMESFKTISDLEKIIHDKNRTITTLQSDITYLKTLIADSENNLLDMTKELEVSKENCHQLSAQLKKIVHQKNEEIADLKKQVIKMSATENKATQIIKVSAKYQAIILKRIAEIKSNTILKELTNFGNTSNGDNELRRSLNAGTVTMEDLENFLETTDKHLRRCSEKQIALQKERDRLIEVNRINESEIINLKKFLTELSVSFKTFNSVKDLYTQKLSRVVSVQRNVRREILSLDGRINDATMCKLERGYAAVMQDLTECVMNMERWVERCISRTTSPEKIKQAFTSNEERASLATSSFQNTGLEVQLEELEKSFQKLLEEVVRAQKGEGARDAQAVTVMEVRAEYEDKLNRMKAKMKQLYQEQITVYKEKQKEEIAMLERELLKTREKLAESSRAYEEHIRALTTELWSVGEKFLTKKDEVEWLRKKQRSGSLMSLQHVHSSGLVPSQEAPPRPSDSCSLRSLPVHNNTKREGRGLHMSDEEGEVFDNRWLQELSATPRGRASSVVPSTPGGPGRISELRWRNSLCPPHLKSSYPAETQFAPVLDEEDIKCIGATGSIGGRNQRKEVGITAYKKPGPPTPSKQAGRLSATDSELRESLRMEPEAQPSRKTSTPSRLRSLFRSNKTDTTEGTPRSRRLSIFRKK